MSAIRQAGKIWLYMLLLALFSLMIAPLLMLDSPLLRVPLNLALFAGVALLAYKDGGFRGQKEVARAGYRPIRGIEAVALAALPFFVAAAALAVLAKPYTYTLQNLPPWLVSYMGREDIGGALRFYENRQDIGLIGYVRFAMYQAIRPFYFIASGFGDQALLLLDRLSPLLVLIIPGAYAAGYLRGPVLHRRAAEHVEEAKRLHQKKVARKKKRERQAREAKRPERLI